MLELGSRTFGFGRGKNGKEKKGKKGEREKKKGGGGQMHSKRRENRRGIEQASGKQTRVVESGSVSMLARGCQHICPQ